MRAPSAVRALVVPLAALVPAFACGRSAEPAAARPDPIASSSKPAAHARDEVLAWLKTTEVDDSSYAKKVLYSWTTLASIDDLAGATPKLLLTKSFANTGQVSGYDVDLVAAPSGDAMVQQLRTYSFSLHRYAWTAPWATVLGLSDRTYGDRLVRVVLKVGAVIARLSCHDAGGKIECEPLRYSNLAGDSIEPSEIAAHPERVGAVFHEHPADGVNPGYREYVLVNESQIEEWSVGTALIREGLDRDASMLAALGTMLPTIDLSKIESVWAHGPQPDDLTQAYAASLAFANLRYAQIAYDPLLKALAPADPPRDPIVQRPSMTWSPSPMGTPAPMGTPMIPYPKKYPYAT